jgi:hypothetical protein
MRKDDGAGEAKIIDSPTLGGFRPGADAAFRLMSGTHCSDPSGRSPILPMSSGATHRSTKRRSVLLALALLILSFSMPLVAQQPKEGDKAPGGSDTAASQPIVEETDLAPAPRPLTPEEMPPVPPQVTWDGEQLTISTDNSTLGAVLEAVRTSTGADIDIPGSAAGERVAVHLGPASAREVLSDLLGGTDFDYIIQAADDNPRGVQAVLLTPRSKGNGRPASGREVLAAQQRHDPYRRAVAPAAVESSDESGTVGTNGAETATQVAAAASPAADPNRSSQNSQAEPAATPTPDAQPTETAQASVPAATASNTDGRAPSLFDQKVMDMESLFQQRKLKGKTSN